MEISKSRLKELKNSFISQLSIQDLKDPVLDKKFQKYLKDNTTKPQK
jgi:hypothetical protein